MVEEFLNELDNNNYVNDDEKSNDEDIDIIRFFFDSDREGKCTYKTCKKIYDLIKDVDFKENKYLNKNDYDEIKLFLKECYQKRRMMIWYTKGV